MGQLGGPGSYFASFEEADAWMAFDADVEEQERKSYDENDRFVEWHRWLRKWLAQGY